MSKNRLQEKLKNLPTNPGVYQFLNTEGKIIYIGKAKNLRGRIKSYFNKNQINAKTEVLVSKISDLQLIITDSEIEALVLENNLIKEHKPKYNILLKDDKSFPYIRITNEPFPRIFSTRQIIKDGSKYFGPYTDVKSLNHSLRMIKSLFKIRNCKLKLDPKSIEKNNYKTCLEFHIKKCDGPCENFISENNYKITVEQVIKLLQGKTNELVSELAKEMQTASENFEFEKAAEFRDKISQLNIYSEKQKVVSTDNHDKDIIAIAAEEKDAACTILQIRSGKLIGKKQFKFSSNIDSSLNEIYLSAIKFYYNEYVDIPREIIVETLPNDSDLLIEWLSHKTSRKVKFFIPQIKSETKSILGMCKKNAELFLKEIKLKKMKREGNVPFVLSSLKRDLSLKKLPRKIECFDISNLQGTDTVASLVVFVDGKPKKSLYRRFIIKSVSGPDDFASMREVIERRYSRLKNEKQSLPDLIMVDGGKGQLSSAVEILHKLGFRDFEIIGLAKRLEEIFFPEISEAQTIPKTSSSLKLLQHLRDEAHRFAITFHRERRNKRTITSELTKIPGIGKKSAEKLLSNFNSIEEIKTAPVEKLSAVVNKNIANKIHTFYLTSRS